ncbi:TrkH family potassium uptake protein [Thiovibrio sp. JS02]
MRLTKKIPPFSLPILFFALIICVGATLLHIPGSHAAAPLSWTDAFFTATSAVCVTGLTVVDTGSFFSLQGQSIIVILIQLGGLGIMTFTGLFYYLWRKQVSLTDKIAVGQSLLHDPGFHLGTFLLRIVLWTFLIEAAGGVAIHLLSPGGFPPFFAIFHAISAFCNAGFGLYGDSLTAWQGNWPINLVIMALIILGGLGFSVIVELHTYTASRLTRAGTRRKKSHLSWYALLVIKTSFFLILAGAAAIYCAEFFGGKPAMPTATSLLAALFQSVTCRTAGFNTLPIGEMSNVSLLIMIMLMFIGGAPGSCAGGIKVTSFRVLTAFLLAQFKGRDQAVIGTRAASRQSVNKALILFIFAAIIIMLATLVLNISEGGPLPHPMTRGLAMEIFFEVVSAFGTVGLSTGLTPQLSPFGKWVVILLMFLGRLGPIVFLATIQSLQKKEAYHWAEEDPLIG